MWAKVKSGVVHYRTVIFHAIYGVPCTAAALLDQLKIVDLNPIFGDKTAKYVAMIAVGALIMHFLSDTKAFSLKDDRNA